MTLTDVVKHQSVQGKLWKSPRRYDALLLVSFGGPEGQDEVLPFLRRVTHGRDVPEERLEEVAHHYRRFGGVSPINAQNRALRAALEAELAERGMTLPVLWGNRNSEPTIAQALREADDAGYRSLLALTTSAYSCYSSCRQYREDLAAALQETALEGQLSVDKIRQYFDHPGFVAPFVEGTRAGLSLLDARGVGKQHVFFVTHSIPLRDAQASGRFAEEARSFAEGSAYVAQHLAVAEAIMGQMQRAVPWSLVYQSRSGPLRVPWLEPDINDALTEAAQQGVEGVVVVPLGFVSDHMEVVWDLDHEAQETAERLGLVMERIATPGTHKLFVSGLIDLVRERMLLEGEQPRTVQEPRPAVTTLGPWYDLCGTGCCANFREAKPTIAGRE